MKLWTIRKLNPFFSSSARIVEISAALLLFSSCATVPAAHLRASLHPERQVATAPSASPQLKIVSLNLYQRPWSRTARLEAVIERLTTEAPDVVLFQEVSRGIGPWATDPVERVREMHTPFEVSRGWHEWNLGLYSLGLATLSLFPIQENTSGYHAFEENDWFNTKGYLVTHLQESPVGEVFFFNVHFTHVRNDALKQKQFLELSQEILKTQLEHPMSTIVIGGDFNAPPEHPALAKLIHTFGATSWDSSLSPEDQRSGTHHSPYQESCQSESSQKSRIDHFVLIQPKGSTHRLKFSDSEIEPHLREPHLSDHCLLKTTLQKLP